MTRRLTANPHKRRRILFVEANEDGTVGGSHRALFDLVCRLDRSRYQPVVLFYQSNLFVDQLRDREVPTLLFEKERELERRVRLSGRFSVKVRDILIGAIVRRSRLLKSERIDMVHINNSPKVGCDDWLPACRFRRIPIVASVRGDAEGERDPIRKFIFTKFDRVMPVSRWLEQAMETAGIPSRKIRRVYDGVDVEGVRHRVSRSREEVRAELGVANSDFLAVLVGNLRPWKGQRVAVEALDRIRQETAIPIRLALVGDTGEAGEGYERELRELVHETNLGERISFLGTRSDVPELFSAADVALHTSLAPEPFGLVVVEAMATGTPVIAANRGGPLEVVTDESGYTHDPYNPAELASILLSVARHRSELLPRLKTGALERAWDFDISKTVRKMEAVYSELLGPFAAPHG